MARSFNGSSDLINCDSATGGALDITGNITISAWVYPTTLPSGNNQYFIISEKGYDGSNEQWSLGFQFDQNTAGSAALFWGPNIAGPWAFWNYGGNITTGNWYHVAATANGTNQILYSSGVLRSSVVNARLPVHTAKDVRIGAADINGSITRFFAGRIAEVGIWNVALTAGEISGIAAGARCHTVRKLNLQGYYPLDGLSSPEPDFSGNANNGALTGTAFAPGPPMTIFTPKSPILISPAGPTAAQIFSFDQISAHITRKITNVAY